MYQCPVCFGVFDEPVIHHYEQLTITYLYEPTEIHEFRCPHCRTRLEQETNLDILHHKMKAYEVKPE